MKTSGGSRTLLQRKSPITLHWIIYSLLEKSLLPPSKSLDFRLMRLMKQLPFQGMTSTMHATGKAIWQKLLMQNPCITIKQDEGGDNQTPQVSTTGCWPAWRNLVISKDLYNYNYRMELIWSTNMTCTKKLKIYLVHKATPISQRI